MLVDAASTMQLVLPTILLVVLYISAGIKIAILIIFGEHSRLPPSPPSIMTSAKRHDVFATSAALVNRVTSSLRYVLTALR